MRSLQPQAMLLRLFQRNEDQNIQFPWFPNPYVVSVTTSLVCSVSVVVLSVFALRQATQWTSTKKFKSTRFLRYFYEDKDGSATTRSIYDASKQKFHRISLPCVGIGLWLSVVRAVFAAWGLQTIQETEWMEIAIWIMLVLQCGILWIDMPVQIMYAIGWRASLSCLVAGLNLGAQMYMETLTGQRDLVQNVATSCQIGFAFAAGLLTLLIPRRPDVYRNGTVVDREYSTSFLEWMSFTWASSTLEFAKRNASLQIGDLPELSYSSTTDNVLHTCAGMVRETGATNKDIWVAIMRAQRRILFFQSVASLPSSFLSFIPPFALLKILLSLEGQQNSNAAETSVWPWVILLGMSIMLTALLESFKFWFSYNKLLIRTQELLSVAIFDKAVRLYGDSIENDKDPNDQSSQGPVHMAVVDAKNVADFVCLLFLIYETPLKLIIASVFIFTILGWQCLLSCVVIIFLLSAANSHTIKKYSISQASFMRSRDHRLSMITEILQGIRYLKLSALEGQWEKSINLLRDIELQDRWSVYLRELIMVSMYFLGPTILSASTLAVYMAINESLSAATAFTTIAVFNSIEVSLSILPETIGMFTGASVSIDRIRRFLSQPEKVTGILPSDTIEFTNATIAWPNSTPSDGDEGTLKNIDLNFPKNALSIIMGPTGAGKSLLLAAILGECDILSGTIRAPTPVNFESSHKDSMMGIAYVPQNPWIERGTLKDNIIFGAQFDRERYSKVLFACSMEKDLEKFPNGDLTEIGANGANMSGGQKWRLCLARSLYSQAHTLVMDDIFSAVDVHTRQHLYQHALTGELAESRTRILVTHHVDLCLPHAEYLVSLGKGHLQYASEVKDLEANKEDCNHFPEPVDSSGVREDYLAPRNENGQSWEAASKEVEDDYLHDNGVYWEICRSQMKEGGNFYKLLVVLAAFLGFNGLMLSRAWWLNLWTGQTADTNAKLKQTDDQNAASPADQSLTYYLGVYLGISALACFIGTARYYFTFRISFQASQKLFRRILYTVLRVPLQWHDEVPFGRILNRFSADFNVIDSRMGEDFRSTLEVITEIIMATFAGILVNPVLLIVAVVLAILYLHYSRNYLAACRQVKRLESEARSPIFDHFESCLNGLPVIRAFGKVDEYRQLFRQKVDSQARAFWHVMLLNRWLGFRVSMIGTTFAALSAIFVVSLKDITVSAAGFAISFTMQVSLSMSLAIRYYSNLEQDMNSVERVLEYSDLDTEHNDGYDPPSSWPTEGQLDISNLAVRYAPHLPPVLHGISFKAEGNQRVGVVGRTGSGKSSLVNAIFRVLEPCEGQITLDGIDITKVKLNSLRSRLGIIPQSPVIFSGTIRSNLDPFNAHENSELLQALENVSWESISNNEDSEDCDTSDVPTSQLEKIVATGGTNLSQGQRQLLCIAREIVRKPKLLVLDEATSAVDTATDKFIQESVRSAFSRDSTTLIVIAHRLSTIADFDSILVLDAGEVVEFGSPRDLLGIPNGVFKGMIDQDAESDLLKRMIFSDKGNA